MQHGIEAHPSHQSHPNVLPLTALEQGHRCKSPIPDQDNLPVGLPPPDFDDQVLSPIYQGPMLLAQFKNVQSPVIY